MNLRHNYKKHEPLTAHLQYAGFLASQTVLCLKKVQCSA